MQHTPTLSPPAAARDALVEQHQPYVRSLAVDIMRQLGVRLELDDLIAYGYVGLVEAAERFDPLRGVTFTTFSYYRIRGAIFDGLRRMGHLSRADQARLRFASQAGDLLRSAIDDEGGHAESSHAIDDEIAAVQSLIDELIPAYLLSLGSDKVPDVADPEAISVDEIERSELIRFVLELKNELPQDEQELLDAVYFQHIPMQDLAATLGVSKSWYSRLHARAIKHLRELMQQRGMLAADARAIKHPSGRKPNVADRIK